MTTATTKPMTDLTYYTVACQLCDQHCHYWPDPQGEHCISDQKQCPHFPRLVRLFASDTQKAALQFSAPWAGASTDLHASDAQKAALQVSDVPDAMLQLVTGPSIRRDLWPLTRRERALGWVVGTMVREPMALVCYLVSLAAVGYVMWHLAAALTEGRLRP